jgi:hypothetical protein
MQSQEEKETLMSNNMPRQVPMPPVIAFWATCNTSRGEPVKVKILFAPDVAD